MEEVLQKCVDVVWRDANEGAEFYLSDGSGHRILDEDFVVKGPQGESETVKWTFENYLRACSTKYPSRTRIYCVLVRRGMYFTIPMHMPK